MAENLRTLLGSTDDYEPLSREERNFAAIVHHLLLQPGNLTRFLRLVGAPDPTESERTAVFFEYAYLRDLWDSRAGDPTLARAAILDWLSPPAQYGLEGLPILEWNTFFGASPLASSVAIQNPGRWSISEFSRHISEDDFFLRACMFKWAFNATPDLVIHTGKSSAVCIEAKLESGEGHYPASAPDKPRSWPTSWDRCSVSKPRTSSWFAAPPPRPTRTASSLGRNASLPSTGKRRRPS